MLRDLHPLHDPRVLSGHDLADDAGIFRLSEDLALIHTVDFFTPVVDDPHTFGQIAVANALSDIYAVGGVPISALNITVFPTKTLPLDLLSRILRGGADKASEAGVPIIGGHTVDGEEPMYGLAVTGTIDPGHIILASGGRTGDALVLTKPLGTGIISTAVKAGRASEADSSESVKWMLKLNAVASRAMVGAPAHSSTDITGFGLLGHLSQMAAASGVAAEISASSLPLLPGVYEYARRGFIAGGGVTNQEFVRDLVHRDPSVDETTESILYDPQTSGGLLIAVAAQDADGVIESLRRSDEAGWAIGRLVAGEAGHVAVRR